MWCPRGLGHLAQKRHLFWDLGQKSLNGQPQFPYLQKQGVFGVSKKELCQCCHWADIKKSLTERGTQWVVNIFYWLWIWYTGKSTGRRSPCTPNQDFSLVTPQERTKVSEQGSTIFRVRINIPDSVVSSHGKWRNYVSINSLLALVLGKSMLLPWMSDFF